jgi:TPR repeat protein
MELLSNGHIEAALIRYTRAAEEGYEIAQYNAAYMLTHYSTAAGKGSKKAVETVGQAALRLYHLAAAQGSVLAHAEVCMYTC